jgi:activator of HSP90 ATPase
VVESGSNGAFTAWDGYIRGKTLEIEPHSRIVQAWRTSEFPDDSPDSRVEILLEEDSNGAKITLVHTDIPNEQGDGYKQGWEDFYFTPMRAYFSK